MQNHFQNTIYIAWGGTTQYDLQASIKEYRRSYNTKQSIRLFIIFYFCDQKWVFKCFLLTVARTKLKYTNE